MAKRGYVYFMASKKHGTLYCGRNEQSQYGGLRVLFHQTLQDYESRLFRGAWAHHRCDPARKQHQALAAILEGSSNRECQSGLEGPVRGDVDGLIAPSQRNV